MKNSQDPAQTPKDLFDQLQALVVEAEALMAGSSAESSAETFTRLRERFDDAQERFGALYAGAKKKVVAGAKYADAAVRENPYPSIAVALGVGLIAGILIGRQNR